MDKISLAGLILGIVAILGGQALEGGHVGSLVQPTALLIVLGGTLGAVMLQSPLPVFRLGFRMASGSGSRHDRIRKVDPASGQLGRVPP